MSAQDPADATAAPGALSSAITALRRAALGQLGYAADLLLPPICLNCREPLAAHGALCARCWQQIDFIQPPLCEMLGLPLPFATAEISYSAAALRRRPDYGRARAVARFDGVMRELIHAFKYADRHETLDLFGPMLRSAGHKLLAEADCILPVPLRRFRLWRRRFNQAALLARRLGRDTGIEVETGLLLRVKPTTSQVELKWDERRRNVASAFAVPHGSEKRIEGRNILLIDDVITTGSTAEACARALKSAGARQVDVLALALVTDWPAFSD